MYNPMMPFFGSEVSSATLKTYAVGPYNGVGKWVPGVETSTSIVIYGGLQPLGMSELQLVPEGESVSSHVKTYTDAEIDTRVGKNDSDKLTVSGADYKVVKVEKRSQGNFTKVIMRLIK